MTRRPERYEGAGSPVAGDVGEEGSLREALEGCEVAYYLVHSLDDPDFERKDADAARAFARAAAATGIDRIVYLGGLGQDSDQLSRHLRSRREVERLLGGTGVPVTVLRAGIVIGHGGVSWELTRQLVAHLPAMVTPRWVSTRTQPIAVADVVRYLVGVLDAPEAAGRVFEVGGPEVLTYLQMMTRVAEIQNRHLFVVPVPLLSPQLSSRWLALVTDVDVATGRSLIDSMTNEVVVTDDAIRSIVPFDPMDYDEMVMTALVERAQERRRQIGERRGGWLSRGARLCPACVRAGFCGRGYGGRPGRCCGGCPGTTGRATRHSGAAGGSPAPPRSPARRCWGCRCRRRRAHPVSTGRPSGSPAPGSSAGWRPGRCTWDGCSGPRDSCAARCSRRSSRGSAPSRPFTPRRWSRDGYRSWNGRSARCSATPTRGRPRSCSPPRWPTA